jgi:DNA-binding transcriptional LysR family regulator
VPPRLISTMFRPFRSMLDLARVHAFTIVAKHENVSRAAAELHISQSPLSRQILALEADLGVQLFARARRRLHLTADGRAFLADAKRLLDQAAAVEKRSPAPLSVGYVPAAVYAGALPRDMAGWRARSPGAKVSLRAMRTAEQLEGLARGEIDIGYLHEPAAGLRSELVVREAFVLAAPRDGAPAELLRAFPLIWPPAPSRGHDELRAACERIGAVPELRIEALDPIVVVELVKAGLGVSFVQASLRRVAPRGVHFVPLPRRFGLELQVYRVFAAHLEDDQRRGFRRVRPLPKLRGPRAPSA